MGVSSVAQIFKDYSEAFFRDNEVLVSSNYNSLFNKEFKSGYAPNLLLNMFFFLIHNTYTSYVLDFLFLDQSNVLKDLSSMRRLVVATGGGAVIRPINW